MGVNLVAGLVYVVQQGPGKLKLAAGLQGYGCTAIIEQGDEFALFHDGSPTKLLCETGQHGMNAASAFIGQWAQIVSGKTEFLMLCAKAPFGLWLTTGLKVFNQLVAVFDMDRVAGYVQINHSRLFFFSPKYGPQITCLNLAV